ncbi:MAG: cellulase family glycosylhydrolase [Acidobacteriota bacterium]
METRVKARDDRRRTGRHSGWWVAALAFVTLTLLGGAPAAATPYGINAHVPAPEILDLIAGAGIEWVRIDFIWSWVEPAPDRFNWGLYDDLVDQANARGLKVFATISSTPGWATGGQPGAGVPRESADFYDLCYRAALRYRGRVAAWGMWNEPNVRQFWQGSRQAYIDTILKPGAQAVHAADPSAKVCGPELAHLQSAAWDRWLRDVLRQASSHLDVVTHHLYPDGGSAASLRRMLLDGGRQPWEPPALRKVLKEESWLGRPFWITETGANSSSPSPAGEAAQAAFLQRVLEILFGAERELSWVQRVFFYEITDDPAFPANAFGIVSATPELRPKPAYASYAELIATTPVDDAEIVSTTLPNALRPGETATASITVRNTGSTTWTAAGGYRLGAAGDADSFGPGRVELGPDDEVQPGDSHTFIVTLGAPLQPTAPGEGLLSDWQMVREGRWWFGDLVRRAIDVTTGASGALYYLPVVGDGEDGDGMLWRTSLTLLNRGGSDASVTLSALEQNADNTRARAAGAAVRPRRSERINNVLGSVFGLTGAAALRLEVGRGDLLAVGQISTLSAAGVAGELVPVLPANASVSFGGEARLIALAYDPPPARGQRTDLGLINTTEAPIEVVAELFGDGGVRLGALATSLAPFGFRPIIDAFHEVGAGVVGSGFAIVRTSSPQGAFLAYALVVDRRSGDFTVATPVHSSDLPAVLPLVAGNEAAPGMRRQTDLVVYNPASEPAALDLRITPPPNGAASEASLALPSETCTRVEDVAGSLFALDRPGILRLAPRATALALAGRSFVNTAAGTLGHAVSALAESDALRYGVVGRLLALGRSGTAATGTRTQIGLINLGTAPLVLELRIFSAAGTMLRLARQEVAGQAQKLLTDALAPLSLPTGEQCTVAINAVSPTGRYLAFAIVEDHGSGDSVFVPAL